MKRTLLIIIVLMFSITLLSCDSENKVKDTDIDNAMKTNVNETKEDNIVDSDNSEKEKNEKNEKKTNEKDNDFVFNNSSTKKLTENELYDLDKETLGLARNEIFARLGHVFKTEKYNNYFVNKSWYKPIKEINIQDLNDIERYNVNFIKFNEDRVNGLHEYYKPEKKKYDIYPNNKEVKVDINGDNVKERILYKKDDRSYKFKLYINDNLVAEKDYGNPSDNFAIVDINVNDNYKEIILSDYGPSNDYVSTYYYYNGNKLINMGTTEGLFESGITIDGKGKFTAMARADILHTWFFDKYYKLDKNHLIVEIPKDMYTTNFDVFVMKSIDLFLNKDGKLLKHTLNEGETVKLIGTNNKDKVYIKLDSGEIAWFEIEGFHKIPNVGYAQEVFYGLCYAD